VDLPLQPAGGRVPEAHRAVRRHADDAQTVGGEARPDERLAVALAEQAPRPEVGVRPRPRTRSRPWPWSWAGAWTGARTGTRGPLDGRLARRVELERVEEHGQRRDVLLPRAASQGEIEALVAVVDTEEAVRLAGAFTGDLLSRLAAQGNVSP